MIKKTFPLLLLLFLISPLYAREKIPIGHYRWRTLTTDYFKIHYEKGNELLAYESLKYLEESRVRYEKVLSHRMSHVVSVFIYHSVQDFAATNIVADEFIDESVGGFSDFNRSRIVVPFDGDYSNFKHALTHELVHVYQYDMNSSGSYRFYPLWLMEGMAEYLSLGWDISAEETAREGVLYNTFPSLYDMHTGRVSGYMYYKGGQAVMLFIAERFGEKRIAHFFRELESGDLESAFMQSFGMDVYRFDIEFSQFLRARYKAALDFPLKHNDPRLRTVTDRYLDHTGYSLAPAISPDGTKSAYLTVRGIFPVIVIRHLPGIGVKRKTVEDETIIIRALRSKDYEEFQPATTRVLFTPDGKYLIVSARRESRPALLVIDIKLKRVVYDYAPPPNFDAIQYPAISFDGKLLLFTGVLRGVADLYILNRENGRVFQITNDRFYESHASFSHDNKFIYYSSNRSSDQDISSSGRNIYRKKIPDDSCFSLKLSKLCSADEVANPPLLITDLTGRALSPVQDDEGGLYFTSDWNGVRNVYRIVEPPGDKPIGLNDIKRGERVYPVTESVTGVRDIAVQKKNLLFIEQEEGALELKLLPADANRKGAVTLFDSSSQTYLYSPPPLSNVLEVKEDLKLNVYKWNQPYKPLLAPEGNPFIMIFGGSDGSGKTSLAALAFASFADDTGDHRVRSFVSYFHKPARTNFDFMYIYSALRLKLYAGAYSQNGSFPVLSPIDFSLNNIIYNPYYRIFDQRSSGIYGGATYPIHRYSLFNVTLDQGREEKIYMPALPEDKQRSDIYKNYYTLSFQYEFNNLVYSLYGPLDGHRFIVQYQVPLKPTGNERDIYSLFMEYDYYHLFNNYTEFAFRMFAGANRGASAKNYPLHVGGYHSIRGYRFEEFEGQYAFLLNAEIRFPFIRNITFGIPTAWSAGMIRGVLFADAGSAFDDPKTYRAVDGRYRVTRDLNVSYGAGIQWVNFLWFMIPGTIMKIEWATPYDGKRSLPPSKWQGRFSMGFNF